MELFLSKRCQNTPGSSRARAGVNLQWRGDDSSWGRPGAVAVAVSTAGILERQAAKYLIVEKAFNTHCAVISHYVYQTRYLQVMRWVFVLEMKLILLQFSFAISINCVGYKITSVGIVAVGSTAAIWNMLNGYGKKYWEIQYLDITSS